MAMTKWHGERGPLHFSSLQLSTAAPLHDLGSAHTDGFALVTALLWPSVLKSPGLGPS